MDQFIALLAAHKWIALAAIVIGAVVRLLKSDGPIPLTVPSRWRPVLAVVLGVIAGVFDKVASGGAWTQAILGGLLAALTAISSHDVVIEGLRGGKELGAPKGPAAMLLALALSLGASTSACAGFFTPARDEQLAKTGIDIAICILNHSQLPALEIVKACDGITVVDVNNVLSSHKMAAQHDLASPAPSGSACEHGDAGAVR